MDKLDNNQLGEIVGGLKMGEENYSSTNKIEKHEVYCDSCHRLIKEWSKFMYNGYDSNEYIKLTHGCDEVYYGSDGRQYCKDCYNRIENKN